MPTSNSHFSLILILVFPGVLLWSDDCVCCFVLVHQAYGCLTSTLFWGFLLADSIFCFSCFGDGVFVSFIAECVSFYLTCDYGSTFGIRARCFVVHSVSGLVCCIRFVGCVCLVLQSSAFGMIMCFEIEL